jgi:predicted phage baseplate assembly protein
MSTSNWIPEENPYELYLDNVYEKITSKSYVAIQKSDKQNSGVSPSSENLIITQIKSVKTLPLTKYGISAKTTKLDLDEKWLKEEDENDKDLIRKTVVYAQSDHLELAEEPWTNPKDGDPDIKEDEIELDGVYEGIQTGRWIIVSGERTDIPNTSGIYASELVMVASVKQIFNPEIPRDTIHTVLHLAASPDGSQKGLAYKYKRETVTIYANVVKATHGETRTEVLGSGDARKAYQEFALRQSPLTYLTASTKDGIKSTLEVRVNDIRWHETESLEDLGTNDRYFITRTDNSGKTSVIFGDGQYGARVPTGVENVKAVYRTGIGKPGNVKARQISLLATKPLGVKGVINPIQASGGADRESRDQARRNAPLVTMALDRLVSVQDYADFARTFAGIGKASAKMLPSGDRQVLHLTIAGLDDIPIEKTSELFQHFIQALQQYGDPYQPVQVDIREKLLIAISAEVRILPDYKWEFIEPQIRKSLIETFGFDRRELGQNVYLSEVISVIQRVPGVDYANIEFELYDEEKIFTILKDESTRSLKENTQTDFPITYLQVELARVKEDGIHRAQIAYLTPDVPDTLILKELKA